MQSWWSEQFGDRNQYGDSKRTSYVANIKSQANDYSKIYTLIIPDNPYSETSDFGLTVKKNRKKQAYESRLDISQKTKEYEEHKRIRSEFMLSKSIMSIMKDDEMIPDAEHMECCATCLGTLKGEVVKINGKQYHNECFKCHDCGEPCARKFFRHKIKVEKPKFNYSASLSLPVNDDSDKVSITAPLRLGGSSLANSTISTPSSPNSSTFDQQFADLHSHTDTTSQASHEEDFQILQEVILCEYDLFRRLDSICHQCNKAIRDKTFIQLGDQKYHMDHACCLVCQKVYDPKNLLDKFFENKGKIYCLQHYTQYFIDIKCELCHEPVPENQGFKKFESKNYGVIYYDFPCFQKLLGKE